MRAWIAIFGCALLAAGCVKFKGDEQTWCSNHPGACGEVDSGTPTGCEPGTTTACYDGEPSTLGVGICRGGHRTCKPDRTFGTCEDQQLPQPENCATPLDENCDGTTVDADAGCVCAPFTASTCYSGPAGTEDAGICHSGLATCDASGKASSACTDQTPMSEVCSNRSDDDCDRQIDCSGEPDNLLMLTVNSPAGLLLAGLSAFDGGVYLAGSMSGTITFADAGQFTTAGGASDDVVVLKVRDDLSVEWVRLFGDSASQIGTAVTALPNGELAVTGTFTGTIGLSDGGALNSGGSDDDGFVLWLDSEGRTINALQIDEASGATAQGVNAITAAPNGDLVLAGEFTNQGRFGTSGPSIIDAGVIGFVAVVPTAGTISVLQLPTGATPSSLAVGPTGDLHIGGQFSGSASFGSGLNVTARAAKDAFWLKSSAQLQPIAVAAFGESSGVDSQNLYAIDPTADGGAMVIVSNFSGTLSVPNCPNATGDALVSLSATGQCAWLHDFNPAHPVGVIGSAPVVAGGYNSPSTLALGGVARASSSYDLFLAQYSPTDGSHLWDDVGTGATNGSEFLNQIAQGPKWSWALGTVDQTGNKVALQGHTSAPAGSSTSAILVRLNPVR